METSSLPSLPTPPSSPGELVVQNGRMAGARKALNDPLTLVGQASGCDVRLNVEGVEPLHCAIVLDSTGPLVRDLGTQAGLRVNGVRIETQRLVNGDILEIGPFRFQLVLATPPTAEVPNAETVTTQKEREALSIQAAAVAAQQASLTEQEIQLDQRATALSRQEEQLASHLEDRQQQLERHEADVQTRRAAFQSEINDVLQDLQQQRDSLQREKASATEERDRAILARKQVSALRRRLRQRWKRHWSAHERSLASREAELTATLEQAQRERAQAKAFHERVNGELQQGRQQLREEWQELALAQQQWEETLNAERTEQQRQRRQLEDLKAEVDAGREAVAAQQRELDQKHARLTRESEGLEARIRSQRARLESIERAIAAQTTLPISHPIEPVIPTASPQSIDPPPTLVEIAHAAEEVMDQRRRLVEQWTRFLQVQQNWEQDRAAVLAALEQEAAVLERREQGVRVREEEISAARSHLSLQHERVARLRAGLEGAQTRLTMEQGEWQTRRDSLLVDLETRERLLEVRRQHLEEVHRRRHQRRQEELARLAETRFQLDEARRQYSAHWQECEQLRELLVAEQREQAARSQALDRARQEFISQAPDSARTEAHLARLELRESSRTEAQAHSAEEQRRQLLAERRQLDELAGRLRKQEEELAEALRLWEQLQTNREVEETRAKEEEMRRQQELRQLRARHAIDERQLRQLREELERIARMLMDEGTEEALPDAASAAA